MCGGGTTAAPSARFIRAQTNPLRRLIPYGGKESVKENRQNCLSRSIRAGGIRSVIKEMLPGRPTKKDARGLLAQTVPSGGKESVKENRQDCLSRSIRAGSV